jgi:hypothetical protein
MISAEDCFALCGLSKEAVLAVAEHEHIPDIAATALSQHLLNQPSGRGTIRGMLAENLRRARERGDEVHAQELAAILQRFVSSDLEGDGHS